MFVCVSVPGLCRTCEIFGAKALVLDSLRHTNDKQFQALSVSSELWLPMLEVCIYFWPDKDSLFVLAINSVQFIFHPF